LETGESYVGSSSNLSRRFGQYLSLNYLKGYKGSSRINRSLLKYGYSKFKLEILEYCEPEECIGLEQKGINLFKPEYNILQIAGSSLGFKHSEKTLNQLRGRNLSEEHVAKLSAEKKGKNNPNFGKPRTPGSGKPSKQIEVTDLEEKTTTTYNSISEAARALNIPQTRISHYFSQNQIKPYKKRYVFTKHS
jgi:group I intron endonuclease